MADSVRVQFSASIGALIKGVEEAKTAINSVRSSVDSVTEGAKGMLEVFGLAFSAAKIEEFVSSMAEAGEKIERTSAMLGAPIKDVQELGFIAKITGGDADALALAMERFQVNLQKAQAPTSQQALALHALGMSAKDLLGVPIPEQLNRMADAFAKFADGPNKTAIAMELLGRSGAQMIPVLDKGRAGLDELRQSAASVGAVVSGETVEALSKAHQATTALGASFTALGEALVASFANPLSRVINDLAQFTGSLSALIQTGHFAQAAMIELSGAIRETGAALAWSAKQLADMAQPWRWNQVLDDFRKGNETMVSIHKETQQQILDLTTQSRAELQQSLALPGIDVKAQAPALNVGGQDALKAEIEAINAQIAAQNTFYQSQVERIDSLAKTFQIGEQQKTQMLLAALAQRYEFQSAEVNQEMSLQGLTTQEYQKAVDEKLKIDTKYAADRQKILDQAFQSEVKQWDNLLNPVVSAWDSQLRKLLSGTETFAQAMKNVFADLMLDIIKALEKIAVEKAAVGLTSLVGGPTTMLGGLLGGGGQAAAQTANTTALYTLNATLLGLTPVTAGLTGATAAAAAATTTNAAATSALLPPILAQTVATVQQTLATIYNSISKVLPSFDVGSWSVPGDMVAQVHAGEMIVPAGGAAEGVRAMLGGGGAVGGGGSSNVTFNVSAIDGASVQKFFQQYGVQLARTLQGVGQLNPSTQ